MSRQRSMLQQACLSAVLGAVVAIPVWGQESKSAPLPIAAAGDQVIIKKEAAHVLQPQKYRVSLSVDPIRSITLTAPFDGVVRQAEMKSNSKVQPQADVVRLDNTIAKFSSQVADAALKIALAEQKLAADKDDLQKSLAQSKLDKAKAEAELAKYILDQSSVRSPFAGEMQRMLVTEGQFVRTGDPLAVIIDTSKVRVEVPMERILAVQGKNQSVKIESAEVDGKIDSVLPLSERFEVLRDLFDSIVSAFVVVDNSDGKYKPGQTVYVPLIPRQPVADIPTAAISNLHDGGRKVQVVRHAVVRDIPVTLMGSVGVGRVFVSGAFADGDEVIYETSHQISDGFQIKPAVAATADSTKPNTPGNTNPQKTNAGF